MVAGHTTTGGLVRAAPKNHRSKVALKKVIPKRIENPKTALFLRGERCSQVVQDVLTDLYVMKKPHAVKLTKKNEFRPFEESKHLEFLAFKNDASLFAFGSHSKANGKRPHNVVIGRHFDYQLLDMVEMGVTKFEPMQGNAPIMVGSKPMMLFTGEMFNTNTTLERVKNVFLDFFRGKAAEQVELLGLDRIITVTLRPKDASKEITVAEDGSSISNGEILFRQFSVSLKKSGTKIPKVELNDVGPTINFELRRVRLATPQMTKYATRIPKGVVSKMDKNLTREATGNISGQVHLQPQTKALMTMGTRKFKAFKKEKKGAEGAEASAAGEAAAPADRKRKRIVPGGDDAGPVVLPKKKAARKAA